MALRIVLMMMMMMMMMLSRTIGISEEKGSRIQNQCKKTFCFRVWWAHVRFDVAFVTNGQIQSAASEAEETKCSVLIDPRSDRDHVCETPTEFITTDPKGSVTLQCALLSSLDPSSCSTRYGLLEVWWVTENGSPIEEGPEFSLTRNSDCNETLTVSFQSPKNASFRCQVRINNGRWTSGMIKVRLPPRGGGRILIPDPEGESKEAANSHMMVGITVGVLGALLLVAAALFVLKKRRTNSQSSSESPTSTANSAVLDSNELVYADVVFSAASERAPASADENTVYASVQCS